MIEACECAESRSLDREVTPPEFYRLVREGKLARPHRFPQAPIVFGDDATRGRFLNGARVAAVAAFLVAGALTFWLMAMYVYGKAYRPPAFEILLIALFAVGASVLMFVLALFRMSLEICSSADHYTLGLLLEECERYSRSAAHDDPGRLPVPSTRELATGLMSYQGFITQGQKQQLLEHLSLSSGSSVAQRVHPPSNKTLW